MPWTFRTKIAEDIACGVAFLHAVKPHMIIHGDLKLANVLVANDFTAKVPLIIMDNFHLHMLLLYISFYMYTLLYHFHHVMIDYLRLVINLTIAEIVNIVSHSRK